jgi:hypothetical protein
MREFGLKLLEEEDHGKDRDEFDQITQFIANLKA